MYDHEKMKKKTERVLQNIKKSKDPNLTLEDIRNLIDECDASHPFLAEHPSITPNLLDYLETKANNLRTFISICKNPKTTQETLIKIYHRGIGNCQHLILIHPNSPDGLILFGRRG